MKKGIIYTAEVVSQILGLPCSCHELAPQPAPGEIVIYYGGWSLMDLRNSVAGKKCMAQRQWYDPSDWKAEPGYYRLLLPVPGSNNKTWAQQIALLQAIDISWHAAPVAVAATALLLHLKLYGKDLLKNAFCRCAEPLPGKKGHLELTVDEGRVRVVNVWGGRCGSSLWLSGCRKS